MFMPLPWPETLDMVGERGGGKGLQTGPSDLPGCPACMQHLYPSSLALLMLYQGEGHRMANLTHGFPGQSPPFGPENLKLCHMSHRTKPTPLLPPDLFLVATFPSL